MQPVTTSKSSNGMGLVLAGLGVLAFSLTFPATQKALPSFNAWTIGIGRAVIAAAIAGVCLLVKGVKLPERRHMTSLILVGVGVVAGYPIFTALALEHVTSAHAAVVTGLLPLATAACGRLLGNERPSALFWWASAAGAAVIVAFSLRHGIGGFGLADLFLIGSLVTGGLGYAEGGKLSKSMPGWQVISWGLVLSLPLTLPITVVSVVASPPHDIGAQSLAGLGYVSLFSMFLGFCAWYPGLARVGVTRGSQMQLLQPLMTVGWAAWLLGESIDSWTLGAAVLVLVCVGLAQWARLSAPAVALPAPPERAPVRAERT
ncbi:DMT family transporter [Streptomyces eurocidicus]|uniref:Drug/metabolite transporter (DMT)-like permease n=1 Tax=Streptomyces eurocidicus TaxID=66423 RepID=A0A7W8B9E5_STREU|nr:DMT family transporter [Streptomyces eurocidicus]MBB5118091.1 drug/metabolite transporter (DMT)-like permease [Streptomyces eurocidicus]